MTDFGVEIRPATPPRGYVTIPYGILGPVRVNGTVRHGLFRQDERALRRAVSMAVQRAIVCRPQRVAAVARAILGPDAALHRLGDVVLRKRGERKKRRAMRRLLRAAGILGEKR